MGYRSHTGIRDTSEWHNASQLESIGTLLLSTVSTSVNGVTVQLLPPKLKQATATDLVLPAGPPDVRIFLLADNPIAMRPVANYFEPSYY